MTEKEQTALKNLVDGLREQFQPYNKVEQIQADMMELQQRANETSEGGILLLTGPSRSGKSKLLKDHALRFPRQPRAILFEEKQWFDRVPVLIMDVPDTNTKNLTERFLAKLLGTTTRDVKNAGNSRFIITEDIAEIVKQREVRLTIFDEAHQGIDTKSPDRIKETATVFKDFSNYGTNSLVVAGTDRVLRLIDASPEFAGRILYDHELTPFRIDHPQEWATFLDLLDVIDDYLRDNVFGKKSGLIKEVLSKPLHSGGRGLIGHAAALVELGAKEVITDMAAGVSGVKVITLDHLARGFGKSPLRRGILSPFPEPKVKPAKDTPAHDAETRNRGRAHRTNQDGNLRG